MTGLLAHFEAAVRPGRGEKICLCCQGSGEHGDGSECDPCDGSGFLHSDEPDRYCPGQPQPRRRHWREGAKALTIDYAHNTERAPHMGETYGQHVEPHGRYLVQRERVDSYDQLPNWETGSITFRNPLHVPFGGGYQEPSNWKHELSRQFGGKRGKALSQAVVKAGHDAIVTHDGDHTAEIVDLTGFHRKASKMLDLWHHTSPSSQRKIWDSGKFHAEENDEHGHPVAFFSTVPYGQGGGYGRAAVHIQVPSHMARLEDEFPSGEQHYSVRTDHIKPEHFRQLYDSNEQEEHWEKWRERNAARRTAGDFRFQAAREETYYHGTTEENLRQVKPMGSRRFFPYEHTGEHAHATTNEESAWDYAEKSWGQTGKRPRVYQVHPTGPLEEDPLYNEHGHLRSPGQGSVRSGKPFRVVREMPVPEHLDHLWGSEWEEEGLGRESALNPEVSYSHFEDEPGKHVFDAHAGGKNVGYATAEEHPDHVFIHEVYVHPRHRGTGIAGRLLDQAVDHFPGRTLQLKPDPYESEEHPGHGPDTEGLRRFYRSRGFEDDGERMTRQAARQREGDERQYGDYTMRYRTSDEGERRPRHVIEAWHPDHEKAVGKLSWMGTKHQVESIDVHKDHRRRGLASAMWDWSQEMTPRAKHSTDRTDDGKAWVRSLGAAAWEPPTAEEQWGEHLRKLRFRKRNEPLMHRGLAVELPEDVHRFVHDQFQDRDKQAQAIADHLREKPLGMHWSATEQVSRHFADFERRANKPGSTKVILHAKLPEVGHIETDRRRLGEGGVSNFDGWGGSEREIPLKDGAPVKIKGVTWYGYGNRKRTGQTDSWSQEHTAAWTPAGDEMWRHLQEAHGVRPSAGKMPGAGFMTSLHDNFHRGQVPDRRLIRHQHEDPGTGQSRPLGFTPIPLEEQRRLHEERRRANEPRPERLDDREYSIRDVSRHHTWEGFDPHEISHLVHQPEHAMFTKEDVPVHSLRYDSGDGNLRPINTYSDIAGQGEDERERLENLEHGDERAIPPIVVVRHGEHHIIADGSHRAAVYAEHGRTHIPAFVTQRTIFPNHHEAAVAGGEGECTNRKRTGHTDAWSQEHTATRDWHPDDSSRVYLRFGHWPKDERSRNNVTGYREAGVSAYDLNRHGEPEDPDSGLNRGHQHEEGCEPHCDLDWENEGFGNDTADEMHGRVRRAEVNRYQGHDIPGETAHLVRGEMVGLGHDDEPLLRNVRRVGDWIDHRHLFFPEAKPHRLSRGKYEEDYEEPAEVPNHHEAARWIPHDRIFGPTYGLDHRLFTEAGGLQPEVRAAVVERMHQALPQGWPEYVTLYLAGSEASEWTGPALEGNSDFDVLADIGPGAPEGLADSFNQRMKESFNAEDWHPSFGGTWHLTGYCNGRPITEIRPYAAYDITHMKWVVKPPHLPGHSAADFHPALLAEARAVASQLRAILKLGEPQRTRQARSLWQYIHDMRSEAFSEEGEGWKDPGNVIEKFLATHPHRLLDKLKALVFGDNEKLDYVPRSQGWSSVPHLSPREGAVEEKPFYYGTLHEYQPGDHIEHHYWNKYPDRPEFRENSPLYTTTDPSLAGHIADLRERQGQRKKPGRLYEVRPTGPLEPDHVANPTIRGASSWTTSHPLHVLREVPRHEWPNDLNAWQQRSAMIMTAEAHKTKEQVNYRPAEDEKRCEGCVMFRPSPGDSEPGRCTLVKGGIMFDYTCDEWYAKGKTAANPKGGESEPRWHEELHGPVPRHPERNHPNWEWHPLDKTVTIRHSGQGAADYEHLGIPREAAVRQVPSRDGADGVSKSMMVAIVPPAKVLDHLQEIMKPMRHETEARSKMHVTLLYLGQEDDHPERHLGRLEDLVRQWAKTQQPFTATTQGSGTFANEGNHALHALVDIPGGHEIHGSLLDFLKGHGISAIPSEHGFIPHITLAYSKQPVRFVPKVNKTSWPVKEVWYCRGGRWESIPLGRTE